MHKSGQLFSFLPKKFLGQKGVCLDMGEGSNIAKKADCLALSSPGAMPK